MNLARFCLCAFLFAIAVALAPSFVAAQTPPASASLGLIAQASKAHIGDAEATDGATIYSGDFLSTDDGGTLLVRINALSFQLQGASSAHVYRTPYGAILELNRGSVLYTTPGGQQNLVIVASDIRITPVLSLADFGRVSIDDACNVTVSSTRGQANVQAGSESHMIEEGKTYRVRAENEVIYSKYLSPDESTYHDFHRHRPCAAPIQSLRGHPPLAAANSRFLLVATTATGVLTILAISEALESPSRP
jgi:hypothetical protein